MSRSARFAILALLLQVSLVPTASAASCVHTAYTISELPGLGGPVAQAAGVGAR